MKSAHKQELSEIARQSDTFHAISHRLGKWVNILERIVDKNLSNEYRCQEILGNAKSEDYRQKRLKKYETSITQTVICLDTYEMYKFLYNHIISFLPVFDNSGKLINKDLAQQEIETALVLMRELKIEKINKEIDTIDNLMDELFTYRVMAETVTNNIKNAYNYEIEVLDFFSLAWHYQRQWRKSKENKRTAYFKEKEKLVLEILKDYLKVEFNTIKNNIFNELDKIVQSSALVETINSIVRAFLNTSRNQINQNMLNLIMFYHNHRIYRAGKRKGKSPMELLLRKKQDKHWIDMLLEIWENDDKSIEKNLKRVA